MALRNTLERFAHFRVGLIDLSNCNVTFDFPTHYHCETLSELKNQPETGLPEGVRSVALACSRDLQQPPALWVSPLSPPTLSHPSCCLAKGL